CKSYGERTCADDEALDLMEASNNHSEAPARAEFVELCVNSRTAMSGKWTSKATGRYLGGSNQADGMLVDQRFCPRIVESELRYSLVADKLVGYIHKKPKEGGTSAAGGTGSIYTSHGLADPSLAHLTGGFLNKGLPLVLPVLGQASEPIPLRGTTDLILASPEVASTSKEKWIVGEFNCSCVGVDQGLQGCCTDDAPNACYTDIPKEFKGSLAHAGMSCRLIHYVDEEYDTFLKACSKFDFVIIRCSPGQINADGGNLDNVDEGLSFMRPCGDLDKSSHDRRYDSVPLASGMSSADSQLIHYVHDEHGAFFNVCSTLDFIIARGSLGQINPDGGNWGPIHNGLHFVRKKGVQVWPSLDAMELKGATCALVRVASMNTGHGPQPRVIQQNHGASVEGIGIIKLKAGIYCKTFGERSYTDDDEVPGLVGASDNRSEVRAVAELIGLCVNRASKSGTRSSEGIGKYLEGGEGGASAVGGANSIHSLRGPEGLEFPNLTADILGKDLREAMPALGLAAELDDRLAPQPADPKFKGAPCQIYARSAPCGRSGTSSSGRLCDFIPFACGVVTAGMSRARERVGPAGALSFCDPTDFAAGLENATAFQPRAIKQGRGSAGEGVWLIEPRADNRCPARGERFCASDEVFNLIQDRKFVGFAVVSFGKDLPSVTSALGLAGELAPFRWAADFILSGIDEGRGCELQCSHSPEGAPSYEEKWIAGEFACSCVVISGGLAANCMGDAPSPCCCEIATEDMKGGTVLRMYDGHRDEMPQSVRALKSRPRMAVQGEGKPLGMASIACIALWVIQKGKQMEAILALLSLTVARESKVRASREREPHFSAKLERVWRSGLARGEAIKTGSEHGVTLRFQFARSLRRAAVGIAKVGGLIFPLSAASS
ncbi:unnamed protein product, partial [Prorocentrum cordatum]